MAYEHIKTDKLLETAKQNFKKYGSYVFENGPFDKKTELVIGDLKITNKYITVTFLTTNEISNGMNQNCVVGHRMKYSNNILMGLSHNEKLSYGAEAFVNTISKMSGVKFDQKKSLTNLV